MKPVSHTTGMSLEGMTTEELDARLVILFDEMRRIKQALEKHQPAGDAKVEKQKQVFNSAFPMLSNPELKS